VSRHLHLHCSDGITGQLFLAALLDVGVAADVVQAPVDRMAVGVRLRAERSTVRSVVATRVEVATADDAPRLDRPVALHDAIDRAALSTRAGDRAHAVASALAAAEAAVHGVPVDAVRFHELGRPRTVAGIVAACQALEELEVTHLTTGPVAVGDGDVSIAHGRFPVPPPAVLPLVRGFVIEGGGRARELTTPSGAAVLAALVTPTATLPRLQLEEHGRGVAGSDGHEQVLTVLAGTPTAQA
jgi:pyridinium-3,5-bisthiocarboxylic acid mononucleotide nickel chelatase